MQLEARQFQPSDSSGPRIPESDSWVGTLVTFSGPFTKYGPEFVTAALIAGAWAGKSLKVLNPWATGGCVGLANLAAYTILDQFFPLFFKADESWSGWLTRRVVQMLVALPLAVAFYSAYALVTGTACAIPLVTLVTAVSSLSGSTLNMIVEELLKKM